MKKIFLIPLLTMLCTVMAWADGPIAEMSVNGGAATSYTTFSDLQSAINGLDNADQALVTLKQTIELTAENAFTFHVPAGKNVTLNLNGFNLTQTFEATAPACHYEAFGEPIDPSSPMWSMFESMGAIQEVCDEGAGGDIQENALFYNQGTLHIISEGTSIVQLINVGSTEVDKATTICNAGNLTIDGGIFVNTTAKVAGNNIKIPVIWNKTENNVTPVVNINGGTFLCDESRSDYNVGNLFPTISGACEMHIKGGIFSEDEMTFAPFNHPSTMAHINANNAEKNSYTAILVPYTNANITGYNSSTRTNVCPDASLMPSNYSDAEYKNKYRYAIKPVCMVVPKTASTDNFLYVDEGVTMTVADGETLHVGEGGIVMGDADSKIIVEAGGTLISEGDIVTSNNNNIELTMDGRTGQEKFSTLLIKPNAIQAKHPNATVKLLSKGYQKSAGRYAFQRFAVPTYNNSIKRGDRTVFNYSVPTAIYKLTAANAWTVMNNSDNEAFVPFRCYDMTVQAAAQGAEYVFKSELVGNGNPTLTLYNDKWNYFGNSYTAPIDVAAMISGLDENYGHIKNSVWVHNIGDDQWDVVTSLDVEDGPEFMAVQKIQPMQAFVYLKQGEGENPELDYQSYVYNPFMGIQPNHAPKRKVANDYTRATMIVEAANGQSNTMKMYEGERFDSSFDSENNVEKLMNENAFNMYFAFEEGNLERVASDNLGNMALTLETKDETSYTVNFSNVTLEGYVLRDNLTGTETEIVSGNTYSFSAPANSKIEGRFEIVADAKMPTAIEDVEVNANVKGIYTLTGQYLGENFHVLPAGVYVINGKKVVK